MAVHLFWCLQADWYVSRVHSMEARAGQLANAAALARLGLDAGASGPDGRLAALVPLLAEVSAVARRPGTGADAVNWAMELWEYEAMEPERQLRLLLQGTDKNSIEVSSSCFASESAAKKCLWVGHQ